MDDQNKSASSGKHAASAGRHAADKKARPAGHGTSGKKSASAVRIRYSKKRNSRYRRTFAGQAKKTFATFIAKTRTAFSKAAAFLRANALPWLKKAGTGIAALFTLCIAGIAAFFTGMLFSAIRERVLPFFKKTFSALGKKLAPLFAKIKAAFNKLLEKAKGEWLPRFKATLPRMWPFYAGGAALLIAAVVLCIVLIPAPEDKTGDPALTAAVTTPEPAPTAIPAPTLEADPTAPPADLAEQQVVQDIPAEVPADEPADMPADVPPAPTVTMSPQYKVLKNIPQTDRILGLPKCEQVDHSYFNDTVFIGDSVSEKLHLYVTKMRKSYPELLGNAKFITTPSLSSRNALKPVSTTSLHPTVRGKKMTIEEAVALSGAKKVYVMLGMNDVGISGVNDSVENLFTLLRKIKDLSPDIQIFVQSATPRMKGEKPTTEQLFKYNLKVYEYCLKYTDYDIYFVDVAYVMRNKYGNLISSYCSDPDSMAIHFTDKACKEWIKFLYTHALV